MKMMKSAFTLLLLFAVVATASAQSGKMKRANRLMYDLDYIGAIEVYNQVLEKEDNTEAKMNIAECYRKVGDAENAEYWYGQVVRLPEAEPVHKLYYGQALQRNGKCDLAREWYQAYVEEVPDDLRGQYLVKACDYEEELMTKNAGIYEVSHMEFNSNMDDMSPAYHDGKIIFASERDKGIAIKRKSTWTGNPFLELYSVEANEIKGEECGNFEYGRPQKFSKEINTKYHEAAVSFSNDGQQIFFTRNNFLGGKTGKSDEDVIKLKVYTATKSGGDTWDNLDGLPFNSDEYSVAHPTLTTDGSRLFFASDMPGGFGGMDLYVSEQEGGRWGPPINLGPSINSEGNEIFPYYHQTGRLYFASDGQIGLGGLDIYYMEDKGEGNWGTIENMGYPVNTIADDFGVVFNEEGTCGHFSSDREGGTGRDDIYAFKKIASPVEILVYDAETNEPIAGASVLNDCTESTLTTGADGKVTVDMKMNMCCNFTASFEEFLENTKEGCTKDIALGEKVIIEIPLSKELSFDIEGVVFDKVTGMPIEGATVTLTPECEEDEVQTITTDDSGTYYFKLKNDCCYQVSGKAPSYLMDKVSGQCADVAELKVSTTLQANLNLQPTTVSEEIITSTEPAPDPDEGDTVGQYKNVDYNQDENLWYDPNTNEPADGVIDGVTYKNGEIADGTDVPDKTWDVGGSIEGTKTGDPIPFLLHIYYDFNQSYVREEANSELEKLYETMADNPEYIVEIGSHTDSRGSFSYNRRLSQRRAESVVRWLVNRGIDRNRLVPVGYGETRNVNGCKNNIPCSEQEHQMNRRTEFRILGTSETYNTQQVSRPNPNARVDVCEGCPF
ncbi:MAG: OmpA family protein [Bacteroidota bacterium]